MVGGAAAGRGFGRPRRAGFNVPVYRFLAAPRWIAATLVVVAVVAGCTWAGFWQLRRLDEREAFNDLVSGRLAAEPAPVGELLDGPPAAAAYRRVWARGTFLPGEEVLVRSRVHDGSAGFDVLTPFLLDDGTLLVVDRGWVPLSMDTPPVAAAPPAGPVRIDGILRESETRRGAGGGEPTGTPAVVDRIDLDVLAGRLSGPVAPVWLQLAGSGDDLPVPLPEPDTADEGPHLSYAVQWFSFATVGIVGYAALVRRSARGGG